jgi:hypothetical protein
MDAHGNTSFHKNHRGHPIMTPANDSASQRSFVLSYMALRQAIGILGVGLPFVLVIGKVLLDGPGIQPSISDYYYTGMRDVFVGTLCAIGVFLMSSRGYERRDDIAGDLACAFALGLALFPTTPGPDPTEADMVVGYLHYGFAAAFFLTLSYFCLALFRKTDPSKPMTPRKRLRNKVYAGCGSTMLGALALLAMYGLFLQETAVSRLEPVFWLETLAIIAFGLSWLTKGEALLWDEE